MTIKNMAYWNAKNSPKNKKKDPYTKKDYDFLKNQRAFYYARVLENPVCRWSTWDSIREGVKPRSDIPTTIQERAWTSPIWFEPTNS